MSCPPNGEAYGTPDHRCRRGAQRDHLDRGRIGIDPATKFRCPKRPHEPAEETATRATGGRGTQRAPDHAFHRALLQEVARRGATVIGQPSEVTERRTAGYDRLSRFLFNADINYLTGSMLFFLFT